MCKEGSMLEAQGQNHVINCSSASGKSGAVTLGGEGLLPVELRAAEENAP